MSFFNDLPVHTGNLAALFLSIPLGMRAFSNILALRRGGRTPDGMKRATWSTILVGCSLALAFGLPGLLGGYIGNLALLVASCAVVGFSGAMFWSACWRRPAWPAYSQSCAAAGALFLAAVHVLLDVLSYVLPGGWAHEALAAAHLAREIAVILVVVMVWVVITEFIKECRTNETATLDEESPRPSSEQ